MHYQELFELPLEPVEVVEQILGDQIHVEGHDDNFNLAVDFTLDVGLTWGGEDTKDLWSMIREYEKQYD